MIPSSCGEVHFAAPGPYVGSFGNKFRKAREAKNISLDDVANVTKIGTRMLKAIEDEHFDQLPGGVFNKGFIRAYAKHLGIDDNEAVNEYLAAMREAQIEAVNSWERESSPPPRGAQAKSATKSAAAKTPASGTEADELPDLQLPRAEHVRPPRRDFAEKGDGGIPWRIVVAAAVVIVLGAILWTRHSRNARPEGTSVAAPVTQPASTPAAATAEAQPVVTATAGGAQQPIPQSVKLSPSAQQSTAHLATPIGAKTSQTAAQPTTQDPAKQPNGEPRGATPQIPAATAKPAATLTLIIRASENSWISVTADGQQVSQETLIAPAHTSVRATREIVVRTGNAAGISFLWNGQEIPAQGAEGEVKTFLFDAAGIRGLAATQTPAQN